MEEVIIDYHYKPYHLQKRTTVVKITEDIEIYRFYYIEGCICSLYVLKNKTRCGVVTVFMHDPLIQILDLSTCKNDINNGTYIKFFY